MAARKKEQTGRRPSRSERKGKAAGAQALAGGAPQENDFPIVAIGASAGGLKALEGFFDQMPSDRGMAFVVVQHLDPKHESLMTGLLEKHTRMKVSQAGDGMKVEPNHVYVKAPGRDLIISKRTLHLAELKGKGGFRLPIDTFFRSLAEDQGEKAICIVLSGAGGDGTLGLKAIKGAGGMAMVQDEQQAEYESMPRSAISTGLADYILPVERMPEEIVRYVQHPFLEPGKITDETDEDRFEKSVRKILTTVRLGTGTDFAHYKQSTITRRIGRRMALHQIADIVHYANYVRQNPAEVEELFRDLLINVTNFFRDPGAFEALEKEALPALLAEKEPDAPIRVWVPGCGTGEEAYSIATLFVEAMERLERQFKVQIFATDISGEAIDSARAAVYPTNIAADVSPERLRRFFKKEGDAYRIDRQLREMVVFAIHDVTRDPPFSRLDLASCRNMLIYMDTSLQRRIIPLFHYGLNDQGILFLGTSEGVGDFHDLFQVVDKKHKIFRNRKMDPHAFLGHAALHSTVPEIVARRTNAEPIEVNRRSPREVNVRHLVEQIILQKYGPPGVLLDDRFNIVYFHGDTSRYLKPPKGEASFDVLRMTHEELHYKLARALAQVRHQKKPVVFEGIKVRENEEFLSINLVATPLGESTGRPDLTLVTFEAQNLPQENEGEKIGSVEVGNPDSQVAVLQRTLDATRQELQATVEELETSNEELKSANEELQANNEELQSTIEEVESSKEELQSTNEELETLNEELQRKNRELVRAEDDMRNLLHATEIATLYLDNKLRILRFTPAAARIFNVRDQDLGRPVSDITAQFDTHLFAREAEKVVETLQRRDWEIQTKEGKWFFMRMIPYRTADNVINGVVITFMEVTEQKELEWRAQEARTVAGRVMEATRDALLVLDADLRVRSANPSYYRTFGGSDQETISRSFFELAGGQWDIPEIRGLLEDIIPRDGKFTAFKAEKDFPGIGRRVVLLNGCRIDEKEGLPTMILVTIQDVTPGQNTA